MNVSQAMKISKERWHTARSRRHPFALFLAKTVWVYPVFVAVVYFASGLFIRSETVRLILAVVLSIFPWKEAMKKIYSNNYRHMRTQLLVLLQVLTTSVSSGYSIEKSLLLIRPVIERTFGKRSMLLKPLINLENNLKLHVSLEESLNTFAQQISFPETVPVFHALAISGEIGNNSLSILRSVNLPSQRNETKLLAFLGQKTLMQVTFASSISLPISPTVKVSFLSSLGSFFIAWLFLP